MSDTESACSAASLDEVSKKAVEVFVNDSIAGLTDNLTQVIENRLGAFAKRFSEENSSAVTSAVKKARSERYACKRKGNQHQLDHDHDVLHKIEEASDALKAGAHGESKLYISLADKSEFGWPTVNEYLSDELASDADDEKRMYRSERRAEKKVRENQRKKKTNRNFPPQRS